MSPNQQPITVFLIIHAVPEDELAVPTRKTLRGKSQLTVDGCQSSFH